ncbi:hypothetical protein C2S52_001945 [Perilla frutescens var. hirtella]|nr:hypothetical protein C2S52_001945 [Perilla frutescens var. hirtella]
MDDEAKSIDSHDAFCTDKIFHSKDDLVAWTREIGKSLGYVIIIISSQPRNGGRKARLRLGCERGGTYRLPKNIDNMDKLTHTKTGTKKIGCPFMLQGVKLEKDDEWLIKVVCGSHNHRPIEQFEGHSFVGRLNKEEDTLLFDMTKNMIKPRNILMAIKDKNSRNATTMKTIYNVRHKHRIVEKAGRSQIQQLMKRLNECGYIEWHRSNDMTNSWSVLMFSSCEDDYARNLSSISNDFKSYPKVLKYVEDIWLTPYKDRFVAAWTDKLMHFGNLTTNRAESAHAKLKRWLGSSQGDFDSSWKTIHSLIELQHIQIKASFEQSLNVVEHSFTPALFRELRGLVSRKALNMILIESKRANDVGIDTTLCGCVIRRTHGLPCAHEIAEFLRDFRPISLSTVHPHWLKLNLKKVQLSNDPFVVTIDDEISTIWSRFNTSDEVGKLALKRKLRELGNPTTTFLTPPLEKCKTKGRRSLKELYSTRRDPSYFEIGETSILKCETEFIGKSLSDKKGDKIPSRRSNRAMQFLDHFSLYIKPYVLGIFDVKADGHCGFRAIAALLGFGENYWKRVREDLIEELCNHRLYYVKFYGSPEYVAQLLEALSCSTVPAPYKNWMILPDMGHLVASRYNVVLVHISTQQCLTYLPLRTNPPLKSQHKMIVIGFVNNNHFVQVLLDQAAPIPPIVPNWKFSRLECAAGWDTPYLDRLRDFNALLQRHPNLSGEIINLDDS